MEAAIICKEKEIIRQIHRLYYPKLKKSDHYLNVKQFKENYMLYYHYLFIHDEISDQFTENDWQEITHYCQKKGIKILIYDDKKQRTEYLKDLEESSFHKTDSIIEENETVELSPAQSSTNGSNVEKVEVIKTVYANIPQKNIGIVNLSQRAGSTFITLNIAKALSDNGVMTSVIEAPFTKPYIFDYLGIQQKMSSEGIDCNTYLFLNDVIKKLEVRKKKLLYDDYILWMIGNPLRQIVEPFNGEYLHNIMKLMKNTSINLIDLGSSLEHPVFKEVQSILDMIFLVVDPLPPEIIQNEKSLEYFRALLDEGFEGYVIVNKYCEGVHKKELEECLGCSPIAYIPSVKTEQVYKAVYHYKIPIELPKVKEILYHEIHMIIENILLDDLIKPSRLSALKNPFRYFKKLKG